MDFGINQLGMFLTLETNCTASILFIYELIFQKACRCFKQLKTRSLSARYMGPRLADCNMASEPTKVRIRACCAKHMRLSMPVGRPIHLPSIHLPSLIRLARGRIAHHSEQHGMCQARPVEGQAWAVLQNGPGPISCTGWWALPMPVAGQVAHDQGSEQIFE